MRQASSHGKSSGRPRKFEGPSRVVTLTLPEETIDKLREINEDRAKAIVMATQIAAPREGARAGRVEVIQVAEDVGMIMVPASDGLKSIPDLRLVQIAPNRCLLLLSSGTPLSDIEIALADRLETRGDRSADDQHVIAQLLQHIRAYRRSKRVDKAEVILVDI